MIAIAKTARDDPPSIIVRVEDPAAHLGWTLRRLEEGYRVLVETRATSIDGARRMLLGVDAGPRADAWLGVFPALALVEGVLSPAG